MTPLELVPFLNSLVCQQVLLSVMIWGPPGIGKSSIVAQVAEANNLKLIDLRLSQLAPTDLRGLPVAENGTAKWFPPEFLPIDGEGILFLDEINMATPAMQGIAQQLVLDRQVGSYRVPDGWFIWAAGNRKSDRAAVFEMPSALANRFVHLEVNPDFHSFRIWGLDAGLNEQILAFLAFRPSLLHQIDTQNPAWPSPRSWVMAEQLHRAGLAVDSAVGVATAGEFTAFCSVYQNLPDLESITEGKSKAVFPKEPSARYATVLGLIIRADDAQKSAHALRWLAKQAGAEWVQFFATDLYRMMREKGQFGALVKLISSDAELKDFVRNIRDLIFS
jgi:MoxR-like ATPase